MYLPENIEVLYSFLNFLIPAAITGISALSGALGNRKKTVTQNEESTTNSSDTQNVDLSNMPQYTPEMQAILGLLSNNYRNRLISGTDLSGYTAQGLRKINQGSDLQRKSIENILTARGLNWSPTATNSLGRIESGRIGEQVNFLNSIPLLQRQLQGEDLDSFSKFFSSLPVGNRQVGTTTRTGTSTTKGSRQTTDPGNVSGGLFSGLGSGLAYTWGNGGWGNNQKPRSSNGGVWV